MVDHHNQKTIIFRIEYYENIYYLWFYMWLEFLELLIEYKL